MYHLFRYVTILAIIALSSSYAIAQAPRPSESKSFMVAAANPHAVGAGIEILEAGGGAIDAAVAVQLVLGLVEPQSSGIGGGAFMLYFDATSRTVASFDGRETAPAAATPALFLDATGNKMKFWDAVVGGRSVGVPGVPRMLELAHRAHGKLPWARLFEPAIRLAKQGFEVSPRLSGLISRDKYLKRYPATGAYFHTATGEPLPVGHILKNPEYAATLRAIAEGGADAFYKGDIARDIVGVVRGALDNPGLLSEEDLAAYEAKSRPPVCVAYRGNKVCGMGPPSSGGLTVGLILGILQHSDMAKLVPGSVDAEHLFIEAARLAYADRALYMADSDFVSVPARGLLDPDYLKKRAGLIDSEKSMGKAAAGTPPEKKTELRVPGNALEIPSTSHFSIVDAKGNAVSMTTSVESAFGSRMMVGGFLLNNQLTDFSFQPERDGKPVANRVEPGKRPRSSMAPTIVLGPNGGLRLVTGSPGGSRIINYTARSVMAVLDWNLDPQWAVTRGHVISRNGKVDLEEGTFFDEFKVGLESLGHEINVRKLNSGLHAILAENGKLYGGADPRREGVAAGR
jgi:gamma-glutamyltranspeptidase/glutathione hydrolase